MCILGNKIHSMTRKILLLLLCVALFSTILQAQKTQWYKGNLHTHSLWSDGDDYPEMIVEWYKTQGYDFLAISDHNVLAEGEKWITVTGEGIAAEAFRKYLNRYGEDWVQYERQEDTVRVQLKTLAAYRHLFEEEGKFLLIQSEEITDQFDGKPVHMNATNLAERISPQGGNSLVEVMQNNIDAVLEQRWLTGQPMIIHLNHPNFHWAITAEELIALSGEQFFEVFNGHPTVYNMGDSTHKGTEEIWDIVNTSYLQTGKIPLLGLATDDSHHYHRTGTGLSNSGRGWIHVRAKSLHPTDLIDAMEAGDFYASSGVELAELKHSRKKVDIEVVEEPGVTYTIQFFGTSGGEIGKLLQETTGPRASYRYTGEEMYVRARIVSDKAMSNPIKEARFEMAWTQPTGWKLTTNPATRK